MKEFRAIYLLALFFATTGCSQSVKKNGSTDGIVGTLSADFLNEISGVAISRLHPNTFYVHNDSGDSSRFFAINFKGELLSIYNFKGVWNNGLGVKDCEDIAIGPGPEAGKNYIYLADIGDNSASRSSIQVYRFAEPISVAHTTMAVTADVADLQYPDGPRDAETILIDPIEKMLYIISKREDTAHIYRCALNFKNNDKIQLGLCGRVVLEGSGYGKWVVSGDITADGNAVLLKTVSSVYYWKRNSNEPVYTTLQRKPVKQNAYTIHGQEEAITFTPAGDGYYILSEGAHSKIYYYKLEK
jgi:hypothetical protein